MILIRKGQNNTVILTLTEKATLNTPYYLFEFKNEQSGEKKYFTASDTSGYSDRYNEFVIVENATESLNAGQVSLSQGRYSYTIYEQVLQNNLDPANVSGTVETGIVKVQFEEDTQYSYDPTITRYVYE